MKDYIEVISVVIGVLGSVIAIYKTNNSKYKKYIERYYKSVLERFYLRCILKNEDMESFIDRGQILIKYYAVLPTYVIKLIQDIKNPNANITEKDQYKKTLYKVLYIDFRINRPSSKNSVLKSLTTIGQVINYIGQLIYLVLSGAVATMISFNIISLVLDIMFKKETYISTISINGITLNWHLYQILNIGIGIILILIILAMANCMIKEYTYTLDVNIIKSQIAKREKQYNKLKNLL